MSGNPGSPQDLPGSRGGPRGNIKMAFPDGPVVKNPPCNRRVNTGKDLDQREPQNPFQEVMWI